VSTAQIGTDLSKAAAFLRNGEVVAIPTETVYGLAGNALNEYSATRIFEVKERPFFDPLIVHTSSIQRAEEFVLEIPDAARKLAEAFWPGPLTLLLPRRSIIPDIITSGLDKVAIRVPDHPLTLELLKMLDFPLAAPSANPFGYISPTSAQHVAQQLGHKIPYILDGGECGVGVESTIIGFENDKPIVYRLGGLAVEAIEKIAGPVTLMAHSSSNPLAPGMLKSHYAPSKPFLLGDLKQLIQQYGNEAAILSFHKQYSYTHSHQIILSPSGDLNEAARHLFGAMRSLDQAPVKYIIAELLPEQGLGRAINDRLRRAAAENS